MAQTLAESVSPDPEEHKQILRVWMVGLFNAASFAAAAGAGAGPAAVAGMIDATLRQPERLSRGEVAFLFAVATRVRTGGRLSANQERALRRLYRRTGARAA